MTEDFAEKKNHEVGEDNGVDYILGLAKNSRLIEEIKGELVEAHIRYCKMGSASWIFHEFEYSTLKTWSRPKRVISKAEHLYKGSNPKFIVTSISETNTRYVNESRSQNPGYGLPRAFQNVTLGLQISFGLLTKNWFPAMRHSEKRIGWLPTVHCDCGQSFFVQPPGSIL